ncbi:hypothetical protein MNBD_NITROSPINAE02-515, partial [hydrothermal vent metagenome]
MIDSSIVKKLKKIYAPENITEEAEDLIVYGYDATGIETSPDLVAFPKTPEQISETLKLANLHKFAVTARG